MTSALRKESVHERESKIKLVEETVVAMNMRLIKEILVFADLILIFRQRDRIPRTFFVPKSWVNSSLTHSRQT